MQDSAQTLYSKAGPPAEYSHAIISTWDASFERLSPEATALLGLLGFLGSDECPEQLVKTERAGLQDTPLGFVLDNLA